MIFLFILSFVGDFVIAIIIVNLILFYLARGYMMASLLQD